MALEDLLLSLQVLEWPEEPVTDVAVTGQDPKRPLLAPTAHEDLRSSWLDGAWAVEGSVDPVVLALERRTFLGEHELDDGQGLVEAVHALPDRRKLKAVSGMLGIVPGRADAEDGATLRDHVEGGRGLGQQRRVPVGHAGYQSAEADPVRSRGHRRKCRPGLQHRLGLGSHTPHLIEVVHHRDEVEAGRLGCCCVLDHPVKQALVGYTRKAKVRHVESEKWFHDKPEPRFNLKTFPFSG